MALSNEQKKHYRSIGHSLKPIVTIASKGLSETVIAEIDRALNDHELIKLKLNLEEKADRQAAAEAICQQTKSQVVQQIGKVILLLRPAKKPNAKLSNLLR